MKILYITNGITGAGGLERVLSVKASYLTDNYNHEVHILGLNEGSKPVFYTFSPKIIRHDVSAQGNPLQLFSSYYSGIKKVIQSVQPDIISVCDDGLKGLLFPLIFKPKCAIIYERHVSKLIENGIEPGLLKRTVNRFKFGVMNSGGKYYDKFIVLTNGNLKEWQLKNTMVIPNPLPFYPQQQAALINKKVIAVGKQSIQKGFDLLLQSWKIVHEKHPDWQLDIYGKKDRSFKFEELAEQLGISGSVTFHEPVTDVQSKYLDASIYVFPSRFEGFGMVLIEAMACGVPAVSFDCPYGPSDIISNNEDGFLIPVYDTVLFAQKIMLLIEHPDMRAAIGQTGRENAKRYLADRIMPQWEQLFNSLFK